jgi:hypothetical protein
MTDTVVVKFSPVMMAHQEKSVYAMCIEELGLTAYGGNPEEATAALDNLFHSFITGHRGQDTLEEVLNLSGLEWWPEDQYDGNLPYRHAVPVAQPADSVIHAAPHPPEAAPNGESLYASVFSPLPSRLEGLAA